MADTARQDNVRTVKASAAHIIAGPGYFILLDLLALVVTFVIKKILTMVNSSVLEFFVKIEQVCLLIFNIKCSTLKHKKLKKQNRSK